MITRFFGVGSDWERPGPDRRQRRADLWLALGWLVMIAIGTELLRGSGQLANDLRTVVEEYIAITVACALLMWRRRFPLTIAFLLTAHLYVAGELVGFVIASLPMQILYFFGLYTGVAYGRNRWRTLALCAVVLAMLAVWYWWTFWVNVEVQRDAAAGEGVLPYAVFSPFVSAALYTLLINLVFFVGAILLGQFAWNGARSTATVVRQAETITAQSHQLRDQAVVEERLRIARELHDVVAHHIAAMGVQAAAARRVMSRNPEAAAEPLAAIEASSREAVTQMRTLLGALRTGEDGADPRAPQPMIAGLPDLVQSLGSPDGAPQIDYRLVEDEAGGSARIPMPLQLTIYRIVQESVSNVRRHSTAQHVSVVVRVGDYVEVEVVDDGRARTGTSGSGLGQLGIRERAGHHGGDVEIGPRRGGGYRVRVRFDEPAISGMDSDQPGGTGTSEGEQP